jgi:Ca2+-transporting ATPase
MWASEPIPFDPMEIALHQTYKTIFEQDERPNYKLVHEYPLGGKPPMMTHVFEDAAGHRIIAAKGAPEGLISFAQLTETETRQIHATIELFAIDGYRVLGVGRSDFIGENYPEKQQDLPFKFIGFICTFLLFFICQM